MADQKRLLELALKGLEVERRRVDDEISDIQTRLGSGSSKHSPQQSRNAKPARRRSRLTPAGRKALSQAMKRRWAERRKAEAKAKK